MPLELIFTPRETKRMAVLSYFIQRARSDLKAREKEKKNIRDRARQRAIREAIKEQVQCE